jgi:tetratricopeptide (TPR) repeat protein
LPPIDIPATRILYRFCLKKPDKSPGQQNPLFRPPAGWITPVSAFFYKFAKNQENAIRIAGRGYYYDYNEPGVTAILNARVTVRSLAPGDTYDILNGIFTLKAENGACSGAWLFMPDKTASKKYLSGIICAVLVLLVLATFEPVRHNGFVDYDDNAYIVSNPHIQSGITYTSLVWALTSGYAANWHPLTWLSHLLDIEMFGLNPVWHHTHNIVLHTASVLLLFLVLRNMTGSLWRSAFVAAVFGVHPLRVESVAWAAERKDVLYVFLWMLTLLAYFYYTRHDNLLRYMAVVVCLCLGLMAKPMMVTLPIVCLLLDVWPLSRIRSGLLTTGYPEQAGQTQDSLCRPVSLSQSIIEKIPLFMLILISCVITCRVQREWGAMDAIQTTWSQRLANIPVSYIKYLWKMAWPVNLAVLYPFPKDIRPVWQWGGASLLLLGWSAFTVYAIRKRPYLFVGWFWYVVTLIPVIGLVQVGNQAMADRYSYLPSIGILIMLAWGAEELTATLHYRKVIFAILGGASIIAMIAAARVQDTYWKDGMTLNKHTLAVTENNYIIYNNMAVLFLEANKFDEASECLQKALAIRPDYYVTDTNMADLMKKQKQYDKALAYIDKAVEEQPGTWMVHFTRGEILEAMGQSDAALQCYNKAVELNGDKFPPFYNAGALLARYGMFKEAVPYFQEAIRCNPNWVNAYRDLGLTMQCLGQMEDAISNYQKALKIDPDNPVVHCQLGYCFGKQGKIQDAISCYRQALQLKPDFLPGLNQLALVLATSSDRGVRNPPEAVQLAKKACEITSFKDYRMLDVLSTAYAGANQFPEAIDILRQAIPLAQASKDTDSVGQLTEKLKMYQNGRTSLESDAGNHEIKDSGTVLQ